MVLAEAVLLVGDVVAPGGLRPFGAFADSVPHGQVSHEVVGGGAVPVPLVGRRVDRLACADLDDVAAAGLDKADAVDDVQRLADGVGVPCRCGLRVRSGPG